MDNLYRENILDHYRSPHNFGQPTSEMKYQSEVGNPLCGDRIGMGIKIKIQKSKFKDGGKNKKIEEVLFWGEGCAISIAAASMLTDYVKGKMLSEVGKLGKNQILKLLGIELTPTRLKCALLPLEVLQSTLALVNK